MRGSNGHSGVPAGQKGRALPCSRANLFERICVLHDLYGLFGRSDNVRFHPSSNGGHYRRGGLDGMRSTGCAGASKARVLDNIDPLATLAAMR
jgi:hypothetical protein